MSNIEEHPFTPFLPDNARLLMLGTFPPSPKRWCMEFYYPNFTNDMWRIFGICFFDDKNHFVVSEKKTYNLPAIIDFLNERGVALYDTARRVVRTKNTASDKDLMIVEQTDFDAMLSQLAQCRAVATAGQLATTVFCSHFGIPEPKVGGRFRKPYAEALPYAKQLKSLPHESGGESGGVRENVFCNIVEIRQR